MLAISATVNTTELDRLLTRLQVATLQRDAVDVSAKQIQTDYEQDAPRDTGSMALSVSVTSADGQSDYSERTALADAVNPRVELLPQAMPPPAPGAVVQVAAAHGIFVEYGTVRMSARPVWTPIVERERAVFPRRVRTALGLDT